MKAPGITTSTFVTLAFSLLLGSCGGGSSSTPINNTSNASVATRTAPIASGDADCPFGGVLVESGIDENGNGMLDSAEVDDSEKVCNGPDGFNSLIDITAEAIGSNCSFGGLRVDTGIDTNRNDILDSAEITETAYVCAAGDTSGWQAATLLETDDTDDARDPQVAVDGNGNAFAVWAQSDSSRNNIWALSYTAGSGWGSPELIETDNSGDAGEAQIAADASGNAIAVWAQSDGTRANIWANRYIAGSGWGNAELIETDNAGDAGKPQLAIDSGGNAFAVWHQSDGTRNNIWANRYVVGTGWSSAELIESDNTATADEPQIAVDGIGNAIAVWRHSGGPNGDNYANRYVAGSGWQGEVLISTDNTDGLLWPHIGMDSSGNAIALWQQFTSGLRTVIKANRFVLGAGWTGPTLIDAAGSADAGTPDIAFDSSGNAVAVWGQSGSATGILANRYVSGGWEGPRNILNANSSGANAQVAVDDNGNAFVVYHNNDGLSINIYATAYIAGSGWKNNAELIETNNLGDASNPRIAADANGNAFAVWIQTDGSRYNIWANNR